MLVITLRLVKKYNQGNVMLVISLTAGDKVYLFQIKKLIHARPRAAAWYKGKGELDNGF